MSKELNTPGWLDDVIPAGTMTAEDYRSDLIVFTRQDVYAILAKALLRYESDRPARRPWIRTDQKEFDSDRDYVAFLDWVEEQSANHKGSTNLLFYRLLFDAYDGRQPETGDKP